MIVYEVNLLVREAIDAEYRAWLGGHVAQMLALPGFVSAEIFDQEEPAPPAGMRALAIHYRLDDADALARYLAEHAPRMREAGLKRFGDAFAATRRILAPVRQAERAGD